MCRYRVISHVSRSTRNRLFETRPFTPKTYKRLLFRFRARRSSDRHTQLSARRHYVRKKKKKKYNSIRHEIAMESHAIKRVLKLFTTTTTCRTRKINCYDIIIINKSVFLQFHVGVEIMNNSFRGADVTSRRYDPARTTIDDKRLYTYNVTSVSPHPRLRNFVVKQCRVMTCTIGGSRLIKYPARIASSDDRARHRDERDEGGVKRFHASETAAPRFWCTCRSGTV